MSIQATPVDGDLYRINSVKRLTQLAAEDRGTSVRKVEQERA